MSSNNYYVYEYVRLDTNEPYYIGKGRGNRWKVMKGRSSHFLRIYNKHGAAAIILHDGLSEQEAFELEVWYIWQLRDVQGYNLVNKTDGGDGSAGYKHTQESKKKIHDHHWMLNAEPNKNPFFNKKHSNKTKLKISNANKGRKAKPGDKNIKSVYIIKDGIKHDFISVRELSEFMNVSERTVFRWLSGKVKKYEIGYK